VAEGLGQEVLELRVVVEDRRGRQARLLGDVAQTQIQQATRLDHAKRRAPDLVAAVSLVLLPRHVDLR
jgi:hypothetical protein